MLMTPVALEELEVDKFDELEERAIALAQRAYVAREEQLSPEVMRELERHLFLFTVDEHWRDHLYELDHLKGGIGLRAYGQRDPLIEYKKEAFSLFERLMGEVERDVVLRLFRVQVEADPMRSAPRRPVRQTVEQHETVGAFSGAPAQAQAQAGAPPQGAAPAQQVKHSGPRVGRNDPCPCGSGKKYKKCHMLIDQGSGGQG
jgi:preprotein translocase subunit SecA